MSTLKVTEIQSNSTAFNSPVRFETSGGTENGTLCKAWVNWNGQGTVAIRDDFNVNTITDLGTGAFRVNFSNSLGDSNFAGNYLVADDNVAASHTYIRGTNAANGASNLDLYCFAPGIGPRDSSANQVAVFH
jgi:hypothetical protein